MSGDVAGHGHVAIERTLVVEKRLERDIEPEAAPAGGGGLDLGPCRPTLGQHGAQAIAASARRGLALQHRAERLAAHRRARVAGLLFEGRIHPFDALVGIGDDHEVGGELGELAQPVGLLALSVQLGRVADHDRMAGPPVRRERGSARQRSQARRARPPAAPASRG